MVRIRRLPVLVVALGTASCSNPSGVLDDDEWLDIRGTVTDAGVPMEWVSVDLRSDPTDRPTWYAKETNAAGRYLILEDWGWLCGAWDSWIVFVIDSVEVAQTKIENQCGGAIAVDYDTHAGIRITRGPRPPDWLGSPDGHLTGRYRMWTLGSQPLDPAAGEGSPQGADFLPIYFETDAETLTLYGAEMRVGPSWVAEGRTFRLVLRFCYQWLLSGFTCHFGFEVQWSGAYQVAPGGIRLLNPAVETDYPSAPPLELASGEVVHEDRLLEGRRGVLEVRFREHRSGQEMLAVFRNFSWPTE